MFYFFEIKNSDSFMNFETISGVTSGENYEEAIRKIEYDYPGLDEINFLKAIGKYATLELKVNKDNFRTVITKEEDD